MNSNMDQLGWNDTEYKLKFVLDNPNFDLPQTVQVVQGHMIDEDDAIASGQVLTIYGKKKMEKLIGYDIHNKELHINVDCPYKVKLISAGVIRTFKCVSEFCFCEQQPKYLKIENDIMLATGEKLTTDAIIEVGDHVLSEEGNIIGVVCVVHNKNETFPNQNNITLPIDYKNIFTETISPDTKASYSMLSEIIKDFKIPFQIQFLPVAERNCSYGPHLGTISVEKKTTCNNVLATSVVDDVRHALTFSADLPITIQVARPVIQSWNQDSFTTQTNVDLRKFDYLSNNDPYDTAIVQNEVYDELCTPQIPRRSESCSQRQLNRRTESMFNQPTRPDKSLNQLKRNKSVELGKDFEKYVKSKLGFKKLRNSVSKLTSSRTSSPRKSSSSNSLKDHRKFDYDTISQSTFVTSEDGSSSTGLCSIDITSNGSGSTCNESYNNIIDCMDAMSINQDVMTPQRRSRKGSEDSGICLSGRKKNRSRSRLTPDTPSSNQSDSLIDNLSEWSIPVQIKDSPKLNNNEIKSNNYLWSAKDASSTEKHNDIIDDNSSVIYEKEQDIIDVITENNSGNISPLTSKQLQSMDEIRKLNEEGVCHMLDTIQLSKYKHIFQMNQINGELLLDLEIDDLLNDCKLSLFQAKKIIKYLNGWRPEEEDRQPDPTSRRNSLNPRDWSVNDVHLHMTTINLPDLGLFCKDNQVNGDLLLDILDKDTVKSLKNDHNVKMSNLEAKKLLNFVVKGWRPDNSPKKTNKQ